MQIIRSHDKTARSRSEAAVAIGNFDGIHLGHQALIERATQLADHYDLAPAIMCFEPLPMTVINPQSPVRRLMSVRDKVKACQALGIERLLMLRFNRAFRDLSPEDFVKQVVVGAASARHVVVGEDFRFGAKAQGDVDQLHALGRTLGFEVHTVDAIKVFGQRVASTDIRQALLEGDLETVEAMLGRCYTISGRVRRGQQLGRTLGYPTINIRPPNPPAAHGIYAVRVSGLNKEGLQAHPGVASLGQRPTVGGMDWLLEVHLFDYDGQLYGEHLEVEFDAFIRPEHHFESVEAMVLQMHLDAKQARERLAV